MLHFIHITDTHIGPDSSYMLYEQNTHANAQALVHLINHELPFRPALVLHTGDVMFNPGAPAAQLAAQVFGQLNVPIRYVCGNHDDRAQLREFVLGQNPSDAPIYYDFVLDDFHFLVLDTRGAVDPQGYIDAEQLVWLRETCAASKARSLVICVHHLPMTIGVPWMDSDMRIMNGDEFFAVLAPFKAKIRGVFFGHIHRAFTGMRDGIMCSAAASAFGQIHAHPTDQHPHFDTISRGGYAIVRLTHHETTVTHHTFPRPKKA